jgi:tetratricopeptide (TPR) repeat protein
MPLVESKDFGAAKNDDTNRLTVHDHFFPGANTALPHWRGDTEYVEKARELLKGVTRIDIFGVRDGGTIDGELIAPLRPQVPALKAGNHYLIETVVRTLKMGHHLTQGTVDSNELWIEVMVKSGDRVIGYNGGLDEKDAVDPWSHFLNVFMLDRNGNRISRRNAQDIFTPLYNHQVPPGAGQVAHYGLQIPEDVNAPVEIVVKLNYRKFDRGYIDFMNTAYKQGDREFLDRGSDRNTLPITVMCEDRVVLPVQLASGEIVQPKEPQPTEDKLPPTWQRWNDYGIGLLLTGKAQTRQALQAFQQVEKLKRPDGPINSARVLLLEGDLDGATAALQRASAMETKPNPWTIAWLSGEVARQQGQLLEAEKNFREVLSAKIPERGFDFSLDFRVRNQLGQTLLDLAEQAEGRSEVESAKNYLQQARDEFLQTLQVDSEDVTAHASLAAIYQRLGDQEKSEFHGAAHLRYKPDDNAIDVAIPTARGQYPAANHAAEALVIYWLQRKDAPRLPAEEVRPSLKTPSVDAERPPTISSL